MWLLKLQMKEWMLRTDHFEIKYEREEFLDVKFYGALSKFLDWQKTNCGARALMGHSLNVDNTHI